MSYSNCGYPNMTIKKFEEKYPESKITTIPYTDIHKVRIRRTVVARLYLENKNYYLYGRLYDEKLLDDIRLLFKYLLKELNKRKKMKDGRTN